MSRRLGSDALRLPGLRGERPEGQAGRAGGGGGQVTVLIPIGQLNKGHRAIMARIYETRHIPAKDVQVAVRRRCDLCGHESTKDDWEAGTYKIDETEITVTVKARQGTSCSDGGEATEYEIDLCPGCFRDELIPWLRSKGADIKPREYDW